VCTGDQGHQKECCVLHFKRFGDTSRHCSTALMHSITVVPLIDASNEVKEMTTTKSSGSGLLLELC
jgi:hypothetical protein